MTQNLRIMAIMTAYNEGDIIYHSIRRLIEQGIQVYLIDNWSTDDTVEKAEKFLDRGLVKIERFPAEGPATYYEWHTLLSRVEEIQSALSADWIIHHDADEIRTSPWPGVSYREGIEIVDRLGYNCINHHVLVFHPTDNEFPGGGDMGAFFRYYEMGGRPGHLIQFKTWRRQPEGVSLAESGGHEVCFPGRRDFPLRFITRHYPIRSQKHGERKVLHERLPRFSPEERARGWHVQYNEVTPEASFLRCAEELLIWDEVGAKCALLESESPQVLVRCLNDVVGAWLRTGRFLTVGHNKQTRHLFWSFVKKWLAK